MKSLTLFAALATIALFPAATFAQNINVTGIEATLKSTTVGNENITIQDVNQRAIGTQAAERNNPNVRSTSLKVNAETTTIGDRNIDVKRATQEVIRIQRTR